MSSHIPGAIIIEGHVQGLSNARALGEVGIPVYVVDKVKCIASHSKYCKKFFLCPDFQTDEFADFLITLAKNENIRDWVLIPSNDHAVYTLSRNKKKLQGFYKVISPDLNIVERIYDKKQLLFLAEECGVPVPKTVYFQSKDDSIPHTLTFPVLTKGRHGLSFYKKLHKKAFLAKDKGELQEQLYLIAERYEVHKTFTQELIPFDGYNKTISFTAFSVNGEIKTYWIGEKVREHPLRFGTATFARSINKAELVEPSHKLLSALNYTGVCEIEYLLDPRDGLYRLIEINARTWLWVGLAKACGVDYAKLIYDFVNGREMEYPTNYKVGLNWINPVSDFVFSMISLISGQLKLKAYFYSIFKAQKVNALFVKKDLEPGYAYIVKLFSFINKR